MWKRLAIGLVLLGGLPLAALRADTSAAAYEAMGLNPKDIMTGTVLSARVLPNSRDKQVVVVATYLKGKREKEGAVHVRLAVLVRGEGESLRTIYTRELGEATGGLAGDGDLQLVDLDLDGANEIIVSYRSFDDPLIEQRLGEVILHEEGTFRVAWSGPLEYDATRAAREVPRERRDRFQRKIDVPNTLRTRGITLFFEKQVIAVAGERLAEPKKVLETFPLRPAPDRS